MRLTADPFEQLVDRLNTPEGFYWELRSERPRFQTPDPCPICKRRDCPTYRGFYIERHYHLEWKRLTR